MANSFNSVRRSIVFFGIFLVLAFLGLLCRFYLVQIVRHEELLKKAKSRYTAKTRETGRRGSFFDVNGNLLVCNVPRIQLSCSPYSIVCEPFVSLETSRKESDREIVPFKREERRKKMAAFFASALPVPDSRSGRAALAKMTLEQYYYQQLAPELPRFDASGKPLLDKQGKPCTRPNHYFCLAGEMRREEAEVFLNKLKESGLPRHGIILTDTYTRFYPKGRMLANVLGYATVNVNEQSGRSGLERQMGRELKPVDGEFVYERGRNGLPLTYGLHKMENARDGRDIFLTISEPLQSILEEELDWADAEFKPRGIYAIIVEPATGNIVAIGQRPNFDPNDKSTFSDGAMGVRLASNSYEPGSVMKPLSIGRALDWGIVQPDERIDCEKSLTWYFKGRRLTDTHLAKPDGILTVGEIIQHSSNIGSAKIGVKMGRERLIQMFKEYGFGSRTQLGFAGESAGRLPKLKAEIELTRAPIGYSVLVTIFQLARAYCSIANRGWMPELRIVDRVRDAEGQITMMPYGARKMVFEHPQAAENMVQMMTMVTAKGGTGKNAAIKGVTVAGKTGTAMQTENGHYVNKYNASFVGFVPAEKPAYLMVITVDAPSGAKHSGGGVAAPIFKRTMTRILQHDGLLPEDESAKKGGNK